MWAMARPARPTLERELVRAAAAGARGSARTVALDLARRVIAETLASLDAPDDDVAALSRALAAMIEPTPLRQLATDPNIDTAALIRSARLVRFEARGCRHLPECEWPADRRMVAAITADTLARRYRQHLAD